MKQFEHLINSKFVAVLGNLDKQLNSQNVAIQESEEAAETIIYKGKKLRKVFRKSNPGDYIRFHHLPHSNSLEMKTVNGKIYKVYKSGGYMDGGLYFDEEGNEVDVLGWIEDPAPDVFEICGVCEASVNVPLINQLNEQLTINNLHSIIEMTQELNAYKKTYQQQAIGYYFAVDSTSIQLTDNTFLSLFNDYTSENFDERYTKLSAINNGVEVFCLQDKTERIFEGNNKS
ncbi:hypothetical protein JFL43_01045 [Viridibacillus sp. YIM B01967]|uniref:Uncharacterized protein n=1 Tax=Viridibacillus soli TaxID=2798301 RepID=A0ABS1H2E7_9BACL|nr:hypothetical protein [Viridibacillus soli]MBK3493476.1 hypothetical protein [Viridibacillus soli]